MNTEFLQVASSSISNHLSIIEKAGYKVIWHADIIHDENRKLCQNHEIYNVLINQKKYNIFQIYREVRIRLAELQDYELINILDRKENKTKQAA